MDAFKSAGGDVSMEVIEGGGLIALQGPKAVDVLSRLSPSIDFKNMAFMAGTRMSVGGRDCFVTRSGYTGEDGFEIQVSRGETESLWNQLNEQDEVLPIGRARLFFLLHLGADGERRRSAPTRRKPSRPRRCYPSGPS